MAAVETSVVSVDLIAKSRRLTRILVAVGLWPETRLHIVGAPPATTSDYSQRVLGTAWSNRWLIHFPLSFVYMTLMGMALIFSEDMDMDQLTDILYILLTEIGLLVKIVAIWRNGCMAAEMLHEWSTAEMNRLRSTAEIDLWHRNQRSFGILAFVYIVGSVNVAFCKTVSVLFLEVRELPFFYWVPFDWRASTAKYSLAYGYELLAMPLTCISNITLDMLYCYVLMHIALSFRLIGMRMENLAWQRQVMFTGRPMAEFEERRGKENSRIRRELIAIIAHHRQWKRYAVVGERIVSYPVLSQIILSAFVLCCSIYRLQTLNIFDNVGNFIGMILYGIVMTLQIFLPCFYANEITVNSQRLLFSLYSSDWMEFSPENRRLIRMFMEYLKRPVVLKAGNFFDIGLAVFSKTMNNAYSLLALLLNLDN